MNETLERAGIAVHNGCMLLPIPDSIPDLALGLDLLETAIRVLKIDITQVDIAHVAVILARFHDIGKTFSEEVIERTADQLYPLQCDTYEQYGGMVERAA
jgi:hypothetical protein